MSNEDFKGQFFVFFLIFWEFSSGKLKRGDELCIMLISYFYYIYSIIDRFSTPSLKVKVFHVSAEEIQKPVPHTFVYVYIETPCIYTEREGRAASSTRSVTRVYIYRLIRFARSQGNKGPIWIYTAHCSWFLDCENDPVNRYNFLVVFFCFSYTWHVSEACVTYVGWPSLPLGVFHRLLPSVHTKPPPKNKTKYDINPLILSI